VHEDGSVQEFEPPDPNAVFDREAIMDVGKHVHRLPDEFRMPLMMLAVDGMTIPEIAEILEIPEGTVKSRIFYARKRLKETLVRKGKNKS
jgi:RNA polymerase sigma-70 factor (ECF subfamily)